MKNKRRNQCDNDTIMGRIIYYSGLDIREALIKADISFLSRVVITCTAVTSAQLRKFLSLTSRKSKAAIVTS